MAVWTLLSTPEHSKASFKGPSAASLILAAFSCGVLPRSISTVRTPGTSFFAKSNRLWKRSVITIGSAPPALADKRDTSPIGPAPQTRTESPRRSPARSIPASATANGSHREPSSKETLGGSRWSHWAGCKCHRVNVPMMIGKMRRDYRWESSMFTVVRRCGEEYNVWAGIISTCATVIAGGLGAWDTGFNSDSVAYTSH